MSRSNGGSSRQVSQSRITDPSRSVQQANHLGQQRKLAKNLLAAARGGDAEAIARLQKVRAGAKTSKLADAQLAVAREGGFASWGALVKELEKGEVRAFKEAINSGDAKELRRLLAGSTRLRKKIDEPMFNFGRRAINAAANHLAVVDVLLDYGANINSKSEWKAGPYGVLDDCTESVARELISRGAKLTAHVAARFGWMEELVRIVDANPKAVHEKGGDGQRPLHYAKTVAIADFLLDRRAEIDAKCVDHHSTAAQYALGKRPEVTVRLLERGARADIFMPARLGDVKLAEKLIAEDPDCVAARTNVKGYDPVAVFGAYNWELGFYLSPHEVALKYEHRDVYEALVRHSPAKVRFLDAAMRDDEPAARKAMKEDRSLPGSLKEEDHRLISFAALHGRVGACRLMLKLGFDPMARGMDGGTALHSAAWVGNVQIVEAILKPGVAVNSVNKTHGSPPLGWAAYGSVNQRDRKGDYEGVIERLVKAGRI